MHAKRFILGIFENLDIDLENDMVCYKDLQMQYCQKNKIKLPEYPVISHVDGVFTVGSMINGVVLGYGSGRTKKEAEQAAAHESLVALGQLKNTTLE